MIGEVLELRKLLHRRKLSPAALRALQERKLRAVIRHAYDNVPYYRALFTSAGLSPEDIRTVEDLKYIPVTAKDDLRAAGAEKTTTKGINLDSCHILDSSGSTGKPFTIYLTRTEAKTRRLLDFRAQLSAGFRPRDRLVVLGPERAYQTRLHHRLGLYRTEVISLLLSIDDQIRRLQRMQPTVLWAYPTVLRALLHRVDYRLGELVRPRALITSAEVFDEVLKERLRADLDIAMFNFYGSIEVGRIASECPAHEGQHVTADHLLLECLAGDKPAGWGEPGVVVVTCLDAFAMPFIRYRLGDICSLIQKNCSCGSSFPLISSPQGRDRDMLRLPSGQLLSPMGLHSILESFTGIDQFRLIQESADHVVLQLVMQKNVPSQPLRQLQSRLIEHLPEPVRVDIQLVDFIREDTPKFKTFVSKLPPTAL
jgi:phenylacetate-CoA ligase